MRVLHLYKGYFPENMGGIETFIRQLSHTLHQTYGIEQHLLTTTRQPKAFVDTIDHLTVHYLPTTLHYASCPISYAMLSYVRTFLQKKSFDLIHYHMPWPFGDLLHLLTRLHRYPTLVTYHSDIVKQRFLKRCYAPLMHHFLKRTHLIVATSKNYQATSPILQTYASKCQVIPMGLNDDAKQTLPASRLAQWQATCPSTPFFLFVGVLRYYKGLHDLLRAVALAPTLRVVIAGDGPERSSLQAFIQKHRLDRRVLMTGRIEDIDKHILYRLCHAVVAPSYLRTEAYCLTLVEGLMHGKPLISTEIGTGSSFVNQHHTTGLIVPKEHPSALAKAMQSLLDHPKQYQHFSTAARRRYDDLFTANRMAEKYWACYNQMICGDTSGLSH